MFFARDSEVCGQRGLALFAAGACAVTAWILEPWHPGTYGNRPRLEAAERYGARLMRTLRRVGVFCGSGSGNRPAFHQLACELGATLAARGLGLVYGGAQIGLMGMVADAVLAGGGEAIGVLPDGLFSREVPHTGLTELHRVGDMHERKRLMYDLADGFVILPGGLGTLDELFEAATWNQLRLHEPLKPITLLDSEGFWEPLLACVDAMVDAGFVKATARAMLQRSATPADALEQLETYTFEQ